MESANAKKCEVRLCIQTSSRLEAEIRRLAKKCEEQLDGKFFAIFGFETDLAWMYETLKEFSMSCDRYLVIDERSEKVTRDYLSYLKLFLDDGWQVRIVSRLSVPGFQHIKAIITKDDWCLASGSFNKRHIRNHVDLIAIAADAGEYVSAWTNLIKELEPHSVTMDNLGTLKLISDGRQAEPKNLEKRVSGFMAWCGRLGGLRSSLYREISSSISGIKSQWPLESAVFRISDFATTSNSTMRQVLSEWTSVAKISNAWIYSIDISEPELSKLCKNATINSNGFVRTKTRFSKHFQLKFWGRWFGIMHAKVMILTDGSVIFTSANMTNRSLDTDIEYMLLIQ